MAPNRSAALFALLLAFAFTAHSAIGQQTSPRLSSWLLQNAKGDSYFPGVSWLDPGEQYAQGMLRNELLQELAARKAPAGLRDWLGSLPITGRVSVQFADPR